MCCLTQSVFAGIPKSWQRKGSITMGCVCLSVCLSACLSDCLTLKCSPPRMLYASIQISWQWKWLRNTGMSVSASLSDVHPALTCGSLHVCTLYKFVLLWCAEHRWPGSAGSWPWPLWQRLHQDMQGDIFFFCFFSLKSFSYSACRFKVSSDFRVCNFQDRFQNPRLAVSQAVIYSFVLAVKLCKLTGGVGCLLLLFLCSSFNIVYVPHGASHRKCNKVTVVWNVQVSPDAFIQMALQVTYLKNAGKLALTYEAAMTRLYLHGRTETVRSLTSKASAFAQ